MVMAMGALLLAGVVAFGVLHHLRGAWLEASISPRSALKVSECRAELRGFGGGSDTCLQGRDRPWYRAVVRNVGHRGAWVGQCFAKGFDSSGQVVTGPDAFEVPMWLTSPGVGARPHLDPGQSATLDWYAPVSAPIARYTARCTVVVYSKPPV